ncbi:gluconokinase [Devosia honganensis]|uniref:Gluconokinase n=1 Tax=Devosia honganensis TaxID=1610527 RepID=A0ABV7WWN8_9HYPH
MRIVVMGVSGCGKSSFGEALAARLGLPYYEGDALHSASNVEKMRSGVPLTDEDRWPWLDRVAATLSMPGVLSCSALKRAYRTRIRDGAGGLVRFVHLAGDKAVIAERMAARSGHYMPTSLLDSQFATLEAPGADEAITLDIVKPVDELLDEAIIALEGMRS